MDGLDPHLLTGFCCCFPDHSIVQALEGSHKRCTHQLMLKATQQAEDDFRSTQCIARNAIGLSQAFLAIAHAIGSNHVMALPIQAETTLSWYSPQGRRLTKSAASQGTRTARLLACYGCGGPHTWSEYQQVSSVIICPNQNNQGIKEKAFPALLCKVDHACQLCTYCSIGDCSGKHHCGNHRTQGWVPVPPTLSHFRRRFFVSTCCHRSQCLGEHNYWTSIHYFPRVGIGRHMDNSQK